MIFKLASFVRFSRHSNTVLLPQQIYWEKNARSGRGTSLILLTNGDATINSHVTSQNHSITTAMVLTASSLCTFNKVTRANFRLFKNRSHYDLRKFSFSNRIVNIWNSLPNAVDDVNSVEVFKSRLDDFCCRPYRYRRWICV